jgi:hypothetical protein
MAVRMVLEEGKLNMCLRVLQVLYDALMMRRARHLLATAPQ